MIQIAPRLTLNAEALAFHFVRASGPGGQKINKVATAVELRLDLARSGLPSPLLERLRTIAGRRISADGILLIEARRHRTQERNRQDALERLATLIRRAACPPVPRRATAPSPSARAKRLEVKRRRARLKSLRRRAFPSAD